MSSPESTSGSSRARRFAAALRDPDAWLLATMIGALAYALYETAFWRMRHDLPMMMYQALAMNEFGLVPYRDFFDMNMPGTYTTYRLIGIVFGYSDLAIRFADWTWLVLLWVTTLGFLRGMPRRPVIAALTLFTLNYFRLGGGVTLQREFLILPIVMAGLWGITLPIAPRWRALLGGLAFGIAATFKPHLVIAALAPAAWLAWEIGREAAPGSRGKAAAQVLAWGALGLAAPLSLVAAWLTWMGLWGPFLHSLGYLVYYGQLDVAHVTIAPDERVFYLLDETFKVGNFSDLFVSGLFGAYLAFTRGDLAPPLARRLRLVIGLLACFLVYPSGSGQFWNYHWLPLIFFAILCCGFLLLPPAPGSGAAARWLPRVVLALMFLQAADAGNAMYAFRAKSLRNPAEGRPDRITKFLKKNMQPGDLVQPYDWVIGGVVQGMLQARARPATPYLYTFHFYHHVSSRYIQELRTDFMDHLETSRPAFVVASTPMWPFVKGKDTATTFPAFDSWLEANYELAYRGVRLSIYERADHLLARGGKPVVPIEVQPTGRLGAWALLEEGMGGDEDEDEGEDEGEGDPLDDEDLAPEGEQGDGDPD